MITIGEELVNYMKTLDSSINAIAEIQWSVLTARFANTKGLDADVTKTMFIVVGEFQFVEGQNLLGSWDWEIMTELEYDLEPLKDKLREDFEIGTKNVSIEPGLYDMLFTPTAVSDISTPILACLDRQAVMRGISLLAGRIGEGIFAPPFSLIEDGTFEGAV